MSDTPEPEVHQHDSPWVVDATPETFDAEVFARSQELLVVVDFWAPWCAPCRTLGPILEDLAKQYDGSFMLVKVDTEKLPEATTQFGVQGIPAVYAVVDGKIANAFNGAMPEPELREWIDQVLVVGGVAEAVRLEEIAPEAALAKYQALATKDPSNTDVKIGLARMLLQQDDVDECQTIMAELEARGYLEPEAEKVKAALDLHGMKDDDLAETREAATAKPDDGELQFQLAESLAGAQQFEEALEICLALVEKDRHGVGEPSRKLMLEIFRALPDDSELITTYRRKLSMVLY
ncbi:MAG: tetratricopeptide repeat protein [Pirellulaceae bacterium]|jgi:putative thioredoxin|nr:tetratricopeptide repeat protein [Pirellulaceae bacterium]